MIEELTLCDKARIPVVWLVTQEEGRAEAELGMYTKRAGGKMWIWSLTSNNGMPGWECQRGELKEEEDNTPPFDEETSSSPEGAVKCVIDQALMLEENAREKKIEEETTKVVAVFRDPHHFLNENISFVRILRDACVELRDTWALIVCISPVDKLPPDLRTDITIVRPGLPSKEEISPIIKSELDELKMKPEDQEIDNIADACTGLTLNQSADALSKSIIKYRRANLEFISKIKTEAISSVPGLTYIGETPLMENVGGLDGLKAWLDERKRGFTEEARKEGLPKPRGALVMGIPGTGKSLIAKATANYFKMPLVYMNPPDIKGGIVGETEGNWRRVRETLESQGNLVVWIDEFEKSLPKAGDRNLDGGTSDALMQGMLNFMQERAGGAFILACANNIKLMPPELLRKGRWDGIFFVDLPTYEERVEIFKIHLGLRGWTLSEKEIRELAKQSENYSGAEIEASVIDGKWRAFGRNEPISADDILTCIKEDIPLYKTMEEEIKEIREWAENRARPASTMGIPTKKMTKLKRRTGKRKIKLEDMEKVND